MTQDAMRQEARRMVTVYARGNEKLRVAMLMVLCMGRSRREASAASGVAANSLCKHLRDFERVAAQAYREAGAA